MPHLAGPWCNLFFRHRLPSFLFERRKQCSTHHWKNVFPFQMNNLTWRLGMGADSVGKRQLKEHLLDGSKWDAWVNLCLRACISFSCSLPVLIRAFLPFPICMGVISVNVFHWNINKEAKYCTFAWSSWPSRAFAFSSSSSLFCLSPSMVESDLTISSSMLEHRLCNPVLFHLSVHFIFCDLLKEQLEWMCFSATEMR